MNPVVHFELPYQNEARIAAFYQNVFGWKLTHLGNAAGNYVLATTAESDAKPGFPAGTINGGFYPVKPNWPLQYPSVVIAVTDIFGTMKQIHIHGGEVLGDPIELPGFGRYVSFVDPEGNRNSIIQPTGM